MFVILAVIGFAFTLSQPAWSWTPAQRLAVRFDPEAMREREIAYRNEQRTLKKGACLFTPYDGAEPVVPTYQTYVIDGCRDPELFLPTELFDMYLRHPPERDPYSEQLRPIVARYRGAQDAHASPDELCRLRALALAMARGEVGAETFDRFLYETIAPHSIIAFPRSEGAARLLDRERGCRGH